MTNHKSLPASALYTHCSLEVLTFKDTSELDDLNEVIGQARAMDALHFGIGIKQEGYNLYVLGPQGLGQHEIVRDYLKVKSEEVPAPADLCYVDNFVEQNKPKYLQLPAGYGLQFKHDMKQLVEDLSSAIPGVFDSDEYQAHVSEIEEEFDARQEQAFRELKEQAKKEKIALMRTPGGFAFSPKSNGEVIEPEEYRKLSEKEKKQIEKRVEALQDRLHEILQKIPQWRKESSEKGKQLNRETALMSVAFLIDELRKKYKDLPEVIKYLDNVQNNVVENVNEFRRDEEGPGILFGQMPSRESFLRRYDVNVLVNHSGEKAAPVVYEDNPTHDNIVGRVEHLAHMGALITDFTLIKPGALHRANGGYLILDARKLLMQPYAWEALKRALYSQEIRIESLGQMLSLISTVSLQPEPVPLDIKVILIGERLIYYLLCEYDPEFGELFKVASDFSDSIDRDSDNSKLYVRMIATLIKKQQLLPFNSEAVGRMIEHCARMAEDSERFSTHVHSITDILREADYWAKDRDSQVVAKVDVDKAVDMKVYRADRIRERIQEEIKRGTILIDTDGQKVGQVNGLSVIMLGDFLFGQPARITATARLGKGEVVDIEREVKLGGAIHSKGVLILSNYLAATYCQEHPLSLSASIVFEQSYGMVEGDSASMAELCVLLSELSGIPIKQSLAITGSVNQHGTAQAIGGVNEKIEGFFDVCKLRRLSKDNGVLIPEANVKHLMLRKDVIEAVEQGLFHIYSMNNVNEAMEILTGLEAGERDENNVYPKGTVNYKVEGRLLKFAQLRHEFGENGKEKDAAKKTEPTDAT